MITLDEAIAHIKQNSAKREGTIPMMGEVLVAEIERLRGVVEILEISATSRLERIVRLTIHQRELTAALDRVAPIRARELTKKFEKESQ